MRLLCVVFVAFVVVACAGSPGTRATNTLAIACDSIGSSLTQLAFLRADGKLSEDTVRTVTEVRDRAKLFCAPDSRVNPSEVANRAFELAARLKDILRGLRDTVSEVTRSIEDDRLIGEGR